MEPVKVGEINIDYADVMSEVDDNMESYSPKYTVVAFQTKDHKGVSRPEVFFVPKSIQLHQALSSSKNISGYYNSGTLTEELGYWLKQNAKFRIQCDNLITGTD